MMKEVMEFVKEFGRKRGWCVKPSKWNGETVTKVWLELLKDFDPFILHMYLDITSKE